MKQDESPIRSNSKTFSLRIVRLYQYLTETAPKKEYIMSKQVLRSGTSVGANVAEASYAQSKADFLSKMNIALKEAAETQFWIELLSDSGYLSQDMSESLQLDCIEIIKLLTSIVKTTKETLGKSNY